MNVEISDSAKIALRTLNASERSRIEGLFAALGNWKNDAHIRRVSSLLPGQNVYVLRATDGMRIFFEKGDERVVILDIARKETVDHFADTE